MDLLFLFGPKISKVTVKGNILYDVFGSKNLLTDKMHIAHTYGHKDVYCHCIFATKFQFGISNESEDEKRKNIRISHYIIQNISIVLWSVVSLVGSVKESKERITTSLLWCIWVLRRSRGMCRKQG